MPVNVACVSCNTFSKIKNYSAECQLLNLVLTARLCFTNKLYNCRSKVLDVCL